MIVGLKSLLKFRSVLALALMLWCAGTGCMMVSYARGADAQVAVTESSSGEEMAGMPACHAQRNKNRKVASPKTSTADGIVQINLPTPSRSGSMSCCPLTSGSIAAASRAQSNDAAPAPANTDSQFLNSKPSSTTPVAVPLRLPNRAYSYLLDCAFLI